MSPTEKHIALVCNPTTENEKALRAADAVIRILKARGLNFSLFTQQWPQVWEGLTEAWIFGGDGTLNFFINQYPEIDLPLTIFRGGSGNDFHWLLYRNQSLEEQLERVLAGEVRLLDAGSCNGQLFLNGVGIGFDGAIVKDLLGKTKLSGKASYMLSVLKHLVAYREKKFFIEVNGHSLEQDCLMISAANGQRYGGGFMVAPRAVAEDGLLDLSLVGRIAPLKRMKFMPLIEKGTHLELPFVRYLQTSTLTISAPTEVPAHIDGEFLATNRFEISCLPQKFRFFV